MSASFQRLIPQSCTGFNRFAMARGISGCHDAVPALLAKRHDFDRRPSSAQIFHSASSFHERVRISDSVHKETFHREIANTRVCGGTGAGRSQFAEYDLAGRVFIATGGAQGLGLSMAEALADAGGKGELS